MDERQKSPVARSRYNDFMQRKKSTGIQPERDAERKGDTAIAKKRWERQESLSLTANPSDERKAKSVRHHRPQKEKSFNKKR